MIVYLNMLLTIFLLSIAIKNLWPQKMSLQAYGVLCIVLAVAAVPVTFSSYMQYGLFSILVAVCIYGLVAYRDTRPQNISMGLLGCILTVVIDNLLAGVFSLLPVSIRETPFLSFCVVLAHIALLYFVTLYCGKLIKKGLWFSRRIWEIPQVWYFLDATVLLFAIVFLFNRIIRGETESAVSTLFYNGLIAVGYFLVVLFLFLSMFRSYREKIQQETKHKSFQDLQEYTRNLEAMYNSLRAFKHDYINILTSMSGYIDNGNIEELRAYFESKILPTKKLIDQGDYKLNQLSNIRVLEIKSLISAKMIYAHETGIDVTIDIPDPVGHFSMDTVDLARVLGIFLDNAIEAALETDHPKVGLNIIQNLNTVAIIVSNTFRENDLALHKLKQKGFSTKKGHPGIGLSNAQKIINSYNNVLLETTKQGGYFTQYMEIAIGKE